MAASPTVGDVKSLNKLARQIKSQPVKLQYWPLAGPLRILGFLDGSHRNNDDGSSQRGMTVFLAESRERSSRDGMTDGSLIKYESQKISKDCALHCPGRAVIFQLSALVSCQFHQGLWMDISGEAANIRIKIEVKNLETTARTIHLLEQEETIHMISVLRKEARSGSIHVLAHLPNPHCLADCLTKASAKADCLITAVKTGKLLDVDIRHDFKNAYGAQGFLVYLVQNIYAHKG